MFGIFEPVQRWRQGRRNSAWIRSPTQNCSLCCTKGSVRNPALRLIGGFGGLSLVALGLKNDFGALHPQRLAGRRSRRAKRRRDCFGLSPGFVSANTPQPVLGTIPSELHPGAAAIGWVRRPEWRYQLTRRRHGCFVPSFGLCNKSAPQPVFRAIPSELHLAAVAIGLVGLRSELHGPRGRRRNPTSAAL